MVESIQQDLFLVNGEIFFSTDMQNASDDAAPATQFGGKVWFLRRFEIIERKEDTNRNDDPDRLKGTIRIWLTGIQVF